MKLIMFVAFFIFLVLNAYASECPNWQGKYDCHSLNQEEFKLEEVPLIIEFNKEKNSYKFEIPGLPESFRVIADGAQRKKTLFNENWLGKAQCLAQKHSLVSSAVIIGKGRDHQARHTLNYRISEKSNGDLNLSGEYKVLLKGKTLWKRDLPVILCEKRIWPF